MINLSIILQVASGAAAAAATAPTWIPWALAGLSAVGSAVSSIFNWRSQKQTNQFNFRANQYLQQQAFEQNKQMWSMQNQYNSPAAQMARLKAAGINPNVLYGQASDVSTGNAQSAPEMTYPAYAAKAPVFDAESPMNQLLSAAQVNNLNAKTKTEDQMRPIMIAQNIKKTEQLEASIQDFITKVDGMKIDNDIKQKTKQAVIDGAFLANNLMQSNIGVNDSKADLNRKQLAVCDAQIQNLKSGANKNWKEVEEITYKISELYPSIIALNNNKSELSYQQTQFISNQAEILEKELANWEEKFKATIDALVAKGNLDSKQAEYISKNLEYYLWNTIIAPMISGITGMFSFSFK